MSDAPNEVAKAAENENKSNAADHTELKSGDGEQTCLPNPKMIGIAPPDNNENTKLARRFNVGDHVQVLRKGHKRNGMRGTIVKQTKCYAFFKDDNTNETIRIMPCSLALVTCEASPTETPIESLSLHIESQSKVSSESYLSSLPSKKPTDFPYTEQREGCVRTFQVWRQGGYSSKTHCEICCGRIQRQIAT